MTLTLRFLFSLIACLIIAEIVWTSQIEGKIYHCTDETGLGFLLPGDWYHPAHDTIQKNWSNDRLWSLWQSYLTVSILSALTLTGILSALTKNKKPANQH